MTEESRLGQADPPPYHAALIDGGPKRGGLNHLPACRREMLQENRAVRVDLATKPP